jgi:aminomethyltransferase
MSFVAVRLGGVDLTVCRTGYTGEHGYELVVPATHAEEVWDAIFGTGLEVRAAGLAARDTLRTEMGYPLHGQDLSLEITPVQARVGWAVGWKKPEFWGRDALISEREGGPRRTLWGLVAADRGIPRPHMAVLHGEERVGEVTSGTFSPTRKVGIALALVDATSGLGENDDVEIDIRGRRSTARIVKPPFVAPSVK